MTLNELSKQAEELYNKFESDYNQSSDNNTNTVFTDDEILDILLDELSAPNYEPELIYSQPAGHFDEQTLEQYLSMTDEDGEYIHPYNIELN